MTKPSWLTERAWRVLRTAFQVFCGVFGVVLVGVLKDYASSHVFDWASLYYDGVILAVAAVVAWFMNPQ